MRTLETRQLPGRANQALFADWGEIQNLPVIVDAFDQPILYYAANTHGRPTNMVENDHLVTNDYGTGDQDNGPPYYFHQDNQAFTGKSGDHADDGWNFGGGGAHWIARSGADLTSDQVTQLNEDDQRKTFARYVIDRKLFSDMSSKPSGTVPANAPLRPVNHDSLLLISAGVDGLYGSPDDVSNLPAFQEQ